MERNKGHIDEGTLHAWLDGALPSDESARVEAHVASCAACGAAAAEARGLVAAASRILTALDDVPGGIAPGRSAGHGVRRWTGWPLRAAAAVLFVVAGSITVIERMPERYVAPNAALAPVAQEPLRDSTAVAPQPAAIAPPREKKQLAVAPIRAKAPAKPAPPPAPAPAAQAAAESRVAAMDSTGVHAIPEAPQQLRQVAVAGAKAAGAPGGVASAMQGIDRRKSPRYPNGCYSIDAAGLPGRIDLPSARIPPPDSARFRTAHWGLTEGDSMQIQLTDTAGVKQTITVQLGDSVLNGQVTRSDSAAAKPFVATRTAERCP